MFSANVVVADVRPVSHEDVWLMQRLGTPVVSPNGRYAIVDVTEPSYEKDAAVSDLWLIDIDGRQQPRRLTATTEGESAVDWSPDGRRIAFSTKRGDDEVDQIYVLNMDGPGEAVRLTSVSTGAELTPRNGVPMPAASLSKAGFIPVPLTTRLTRPRKRRARSARSTSPATRFSRFASGIAGATICRHTCSYRTHSRVLSHAICSPARTW
jgi:hypothetical protein